MDLADQLLAIERRLWTNDAAFYEGALLPEASLVFAETGVIGRDVAVREIRRENAEGRRWAEVDLADVRFTSPADGVAVLTYRASARWAHEASAIRALASTVYVRRDGAWKVAFHQQTPLPAT
jgi:hypothetical protein